MTSLYSKVKSKGKCIICSSSVTNSESTSSIGSTTKESKIILTANNNSNNINNSKLNNNHHNNNNNGSSISSSSSSASSIQEVLGIFKTYFYSSTINTLQEEQQKTVCGGCKTSLIKLKSLHFQLESIQAEITKIVKSVTAKINNSNNNNSNSVSNNNNNNSSSSIIINYNSSSGKAATTKSSSISNNVISSNIMTKSTSMAHQNSNNNSNNNTNALQHQLIIKNDHNVDALLEFQNDETSSTKGNKISRSTNICQRFNPEIMLNHLNRIDEKSDSGQQLDDDDLEDDKSIIVKSEENLSDFHSGIDDDHCYLDVKLETGDVVHEDFDYLENTYWNQSSEETFDQNSFMDMNDDDGSESHVHLSMKTELLEGFQEEEVLGIGQDSDFMEQYMAGPLESIPGLDLSDPEQLSNFAGLKRQDSTNNDPRRTIACSQPGCYKMFPNHHALKKHQKTHAPRTFICNLCSKSFVENSKLKRHKLVHTKVKPFKCNFEGCGKQFSLDFNLRTHMRIHSDERPYVCPYLECGRKFVQSTNLKSHLLTHTRTKNKKRSRNEEFVTDIEVQLIDMSSESD